MSSIILSQKQCNKKLREIRVLKQKEKHTAEELAKIQKEEYYKNIIKREYRKVLHDIPDDVQEYIWSFVDVNTKLNFFRKIYTPDFINSKLLSFESNPPTIKKLFSCLKYVKQIFTHYLNKNGDIYKKWGYYIIDCQYYPTNVEYFLDTDLPVYNNRYYLNILVSLITIGIKNYTKIYAIKNNDIHEIEKDIIKLFIRIKNM